MDKPNVTMTQEQRTEVFELYKQHADAMLRAGHAFQQEGMCARFIKEDDKANEILWRIQRLRDRLDV